MLRNFDWTHGQFFDSGGIASSIEEDDEEFSDANMRRLAQADTKDERFQPCIHFVYVVLHRVIM